MSKINHRLHKIYKRRFHNVVELEDYKCGSEQPIVVISPFYNAEAYIEKCINSVAQQDYNNYHHILIDDCSTDNGFNRAVEAVYKLPKSMLSKFSVIKNTENKGAHRNQIETIRQLTDDNAIIMILDGDDSLVNDNSIFSYYNNIYDGTTEFTYGSCWSMVDNIPLISQPYPDAVKQAKSYRQHHFNWILPYTHLRTFKKYLVNSLPDHMFTDNNGNWYKAGGDGAVFYAIIEQADPNKVKCLQDIVYNYNDINPINDYKVNGEEQNRAARSIIEKKTSNKPIMNNTDVLTREYQLACAMPSDINQHLPLLNKLANECSTVVELGVRTGVSTRALLAATCRLYSYDLELYPTVVDLFNVAKSMQKPCVYQIGNSLTMEIPETDMLFIDTDHTYQQLSAELARHHTKVKKYIAFHDTFTYGLKTGQDPLRGIFTAIIEFMTEHPEWKFKYHTSENNGFTVIERTEIKQLPVKVDESQYSIIVPTMWRQSDQFVEFVDKLCSEERVGEIIIINNDNTKTPAGLDHAKIRMFDFGRNIYVNPAWNLGVEKSRFSRICIVNDDVVFDTAVFERLQDMLTEDNGLFGLCPGIDVFGQPPVTDKTIDIVPWSGQHTYGYGCLFFFHKKVWQPIPQGLDIYFGDNWAFDLQLVKGRRNYIISNMDFYSQFAATTSDQTITNGFLERERPIYDAAIEVMRNPVVVETPIATPPAGKKRILIGIPTAKNIETETFKAIYDLEVPDGYETEFQCFYGYNIDQVRNLIAHWAIHYDYLFSVDSDIAFEKDTLKKLLAHDKDVVSGLYIQRKPGQHILEIYEHNHRGGVSNMPYSKLKDRDLVEIAGCGFGCVLVKSEVFAAVGYPQFEYHSAIDHAHTISEDNDFCRKALAKGFHIYADPSIQCRHIGSATFTVDNNIPAIYDNPVEDRLRFINSNLMMPTRHVEYLARIKSEYNFVPKVIYDIGACVLHWTDAAKTVWSDSDYVAFEAMEAAEFLYKEKGVKYHIGLLSDQNGREVGFYENTENPAGNSYYRENSEFSSGADILYTEGHRKVKHGITLDTVVRNKAFPLPDFIKIDVQGAELDVLNGAIDTLKSAKHVILELQRVEYNKGAPLSNVIIEWMNQHGFDCKGEFCDNGPDSDYHFVNRS